MPFAAADVEIVGAVAIFSPSQPFRLPRGGAAGALVRVRSEADETEQDGDHVVPIIPNALERLVFVRLGRAPLPILEIAGAGGLRVAAAAYRLGVLDRIADAGSTVDALAREMSADAGVLGDLLEALVAYGYLRRHGDAYRRTAVADRLAPTTVAG